MLTLYDQLFAAHKHTHTCLDEKLAFLKSPSGAFVARRKALRQSQSVRCLASLRRAACITALES